MAANYTLDLARAEPCCYCANGSRGLRIIPKTRDKVTKIRVGCCCGAMGEFLDTAPEAIDAWNTQVTGHRKLISAQP